MAVNRGTSAEPEARKHHEFIPDQPIFRGNVSMVLPGLSDDGNASSRSHIEDCPILVSLANRECVMTTPAPSITLNRTGQIGEHLFVIQLTIPTPVWRKAS